MCGIVGYIGFRDAFPVLIKGLGRLEYRGYDSAGVALINLDNKLSIYKTKGRVKDLESFAKDKDISGTIGIGHTRWATHGEPSDVNAHPHISQNKRLVIIHNGIIENYAVLKAKLVEHGYVFQSSTDTEVLIQFIEYIQLLHNSSLLEAVRIALKEVVGAYAIAVLVKENPDQIIVARKGSPLVVGVGGGEYFIGSDASPIIEYTNKVIYLDDEEIAVLTRDKEPYIVSIANIEKTHQINELQLSLFELERGGFPHFMLKEIFEQPETLRNCMRGRIRDDGKEVVMSGVFDNREKFAKAQRIMIVACGTSWHAALIGKYLFEDLCKIPVEVEYASEFRYRNPVITSDDIIIAISQSGETADTLAAIELGRQAGAFIYGVCNVVGASIPRNTNAGTYTRSGFEIGVASTKAFTGQVAVLIMMALAIAKAKNTLSDDLRIKIIKELQNIPEKVKQILSLDNEIKLLSKIFTYTRNFIYLGRGYNFPIALEGALKLKEISYIHAEGYPAAEMKHGPIALIDEEMPIVVIATKSGTHDKVVSNIQEIKARKGRVIAIINEGDDLIKSLADHCIEIPITLECLDPLLTTIPLQLLAYYIAINKNRDVDMPRNLAKSVTVE